MDVCICPRHMSVKPVQIDGNDGSTQCRQGHGVAADSTAQVRHRRKPCIAEPARAVNRHCLMRCLFQSGTGEIHLAGQVKLAGRPLSQADGFQDCGDLTRVKSFPEKGGDCQMGIRSLRFGRKFREQRLTFWAS